jgi:hypothetical protein
VRRRKDIFLHRGLRQGIRLSRYQSTHGDGDTAGGQKTVSGDGGHGPAERPVRHRWLLNLARLMSVTGIRPCGPWAMPSQVASDRFQRS